MTARSWQLITMAMGLAAIAACSSPVPPSSPPGAGSRLVPVPVPSAALSDTPVAIVTLPPSQVPWVTTPALTPTATLAPTHLPVSTSTIRITVLAENLPEPDDLVLAPDGSLFLSDIGDGTVKHLSLEGRWEVVASGLSEPEGMVILPDGSLVIAEQAKNRLVRYNPQDHSVRLFLNLKNTTHLAGVDGMALDRSSSGALSLIIPDSPNGTLLRASMDGKTVGEIAHGFARPTDVWVEADGSLLVTDENGGTLSRVHIDGTVVDLGQFSVPDDVVEDSAGNIFVNTLGDGAVHMVAAHTQQDTVLVKGLASPQGLVLDAEENLIVTDPGHHRLIKISLH